MPKHRIAVIRSLTLVVFLAGLALTIIPGTIASTINAPFSSTAKLPSNLVWVEPDSTKSTTNDAITASSNSATPTTSADGSLTDAQRADATRLLTQDATLHQLLGSSTYTISAIGPWTTSDSTVLLGAAIQLHLAEPSVISGSWPYTKTAQSGNSSPYYTTATATYSAINVTEIDARVDLNSGKVVSLQPYGPEMILKSAQR
jgi:hypothetical protein